DHLSHPLCRDLGVENAHVAGQHHQLRAAGGDVGEKGFVEFATRCERFRIEREGWNAVSLGVAQRRGLGLVAGDQHDVDRTLAGFASIDQRREVAAAAGGEYRDGKAHAMRTRLSPAAVITSPMLQLARPDCASAACTLVTSPDARITVNPIPQLKVRHISSRGTLPSRCSHSNTGGNVQLDASIARPSPSGTTRMMFSCRPPPVMWAMPWIVPRRARNNSRTGFT